jgi:sporulation protein YlmC with PRC-barrel domain
MSTDGFLDYDKSSLAVRPLAELPMLRLVDSERDVRGWQVHGQDGRRLGTVADLLVDIDRLRADTLLVSLTGGDCAGALVVVPLHGLAPEGGSHRRLMRGDGMAPIALRYQSTTRYAVWGAIALAIIALAAWMLGFFR